MTDVSTSTRDCCSSPSRRWRPSLLELLGWLAAAAVWFAAVKYNVYCPIQYYPDYYPIIPFIGVLFLAWRINRRLFANRWIAAAFTMAMATNFCSILAMLTLLTVPTGSAIRPLMLCFDVGVLTFVSLAIGVPLSVIGCFGSRGMHRLRGGLGIVLNLAVFPVGAILMHLIAHVVGFTLKD